MNSRLIYPCVLECYLLVARDNKPPFPEDRPVAIELIRSEEHYNIAKRALLKLYPGGWCVERPLYSKN